MKVRELIQIPTDTNETEQTANNSDCAFEEPLIQNLDRMTADVAENVPTVGKRHTPKTKKSTSREVIEAIVLALVLAILVRSFLLEMFWVPTGSMIPTIAIKDRVAVTKFSYWFNEPQRGEIIVFQYPDDPSQDFIKRLIGLPGETVAFKDNALYINGLKVEEPYLHPNVVTEDFGPIKVPEHSYFMCGDNRGNSRDSRSWGFVEKDLIVGKGQCIYWPLNHLGIL